MTNERIENGLKYWKNRLSGGSRSLSQEELDDYFTEGESEALADQSKPISKSETSSLKARTENTNLKIQTKKS